MTQSSNSPTHPLRTKVHHALTLWHHEGTGINPFQHLVVFRLAQRTTSRTPHQTTNQLVLQALQLLDMYDPQEAEFVAEALSSDHELAQKIAHDFNWAESTLYRKQNEAIDHLAEVIQVQEAQARSEYKVHLLRRLESPTYADLVGVEAHKVRLTGLLRTPGPPWIIALEGIGGIGKTALADTLIRSLLDEGQFDEVGWVTARQQIFNFRGSIKPVITPALTTVALVEALLAQLTEGLPPSSISTPQQALQMLNDHLKAQPYLIVIDNLETMIDVESLLPLLHELSNPTKFVLTSRNSLYNEAGIYHFLIPELSEADALRLVRHEARLSNLPQVEQASDEALKPILAKVGGNPLALRLVVGQMHVHGLDAVLADLTSACGAKVENFYTYIYRRAWDNLTETARAVLMAMPLTPAEGSTLSCLASVTGIDPDELCTALDQLAALNLVDPRGDLNQRRYTLHHLTRTFLVEQAAKWRS